MNFEAAFQKMRMSDDDFRKECKRSFEFAVKRACDGREADDDEPSLMPWLEVCVVEAKTVDTIGERTLHVYALAVGPEEKYATIRRIGENLSEPGKYLIPVAAYFTAEAWTAARKGPQPMPGEKGYVRPIDDPTSKDAIIMLGQTIDRRIMTATQLITRGKDGITHTVGEPQWASTMDNKDVKLHAGVLVPLWQGYFARFIPAYERLRKDIEKEKPNG